MLIANTVCVAPEPRRLSVVDAQTRYSTYNAGDVAQVVLAYEERFGMRSADLIRARRDDDEQALAHIPHWDQAVWSAMYAEWKRMEPQGAFADHIGGDLVAD